MTTLYALVLFAHSYVRWAVLVTAVTVAVRSLIAFLRGRDWSARDQSFNRALIVFTDTQLTLGLLLYLFLSPITRAFFRDPRHAVKDHVLRFFGMEHVTMMVLAVTVLHVTWERSQKAPSPRLRHRRTWLGVGSFLLIVLSSVPWPELQHGRPLFRTRLPGGKPAAASLCPPVYESRCVTCHGPTGRADGIAGASLKPPPRNFTDAKWQRATTDLRIHDVIHDGGFAHGLSPAMPAQLDLDAKELDALTTCIRSFAPPGTH